MSVSQLRAYRCAPDLSWVKDARQTILVKEGTGRSWLLTGWKATLWDLLSLGYLAEEIVSFLALLLDIPSEMAREWLQTVLDEWAVGGILCSAAEGTRG